MAREGIDRAQGRELAGVDGGDERRAKGTDLRRAEVREPCRRERGVAVQGQRRDLLRAERDHLHAAQWGAQRHDLRGGEARELAAAQGQDRLGSQRLHAIEGAHLVGLQTQDTLRNQACQLQIAQRGHLHGRERGPLAAREPADLLGREAVRRRQRIELGRSRPAELASAQCRERQGREPLQGGGAEDRELRFHQRAGLRRAERGDLRAPEQCNLIDR